MKRSRLFAVVGSLVAGVIASSASAQFVPPALDAIVLPVTTASVVEEVLTTGSVILLAAMGLMLGFTLIKKLFFRATRAI